MGNLGYNPAVEQLNVHFLPRLVSPEQLASSAVVVIDVLRASTTIVQALAAGAREVIPCLEVAEARRVAAGLPAGQAVLGGERGGLRIDGFDLGNSPGEYTAGTVGGKTVVFTTTNGTRAMLACRQAQRVLVGSFLNATAVAAALAGERRVDLLCAGTRGEISREDVLLAGRLADALLEAATTANDQARVARDAFRQAFSRDGSERLVHELRDSLGGSNLIAIGLEHDIEAAARVDALSIVPQLDLTGWRIVVP